MIPLPKGIEVKTVSRTLHVKGPKGALELSLYPGISVKTEADRLEVSADDTEDGIGRYWGTMTALIGNMVVGVTKGFETRLMMIGVGYRAAVQGKNVDLSIGFSHPTKISIPDGVHVVVDKNTEIIISGPDKQKVGQFAATIRAVRPPEPYQGKGIRYKDEYVRKKAGKAAAAKKAA